MQRMVFLLVTAVGEGVIGLFLLLWPVVPMALLLGGCAGDGGDLHLRADGA